MHIAHVIDAVLQLKDQFSGQLKNINQNLSDFQKKSKYVASDMRKVGRQTEKIGKNLITHVTAPLAGLGVASLKMSNDFQDSIAKVSTIADTTQVPIGNLRQDIIKLSNDTGIASTEIANNVYDAISAGQKTGDAVNFVRNSTKLAKAGFAEAGQSLDILTTIMNAYKLKAEDVTKVSDYLITTQNEGKVTVGELSSVMGKVIPTAVATNTSLEQITTGYALMTKNGIKAAESTTYMNSMFNEMSKTGSKSDSALKEISGKSFSQLMKEGKNVSDVLNILNDYAKKNNLSLKDMFGSAEAGKAALVLSTNAGKDFNEMLSKMDNSANATKNAYKKMQTPAEKFRKTLNRAKNSLLGVGGALTPTMETLGNAINKVTDKISKLTPEQQKMIVKFGLIAAGAGPVILVMSRTITSISNTIKGINSLQKGIKKAGGAMKYFTSPGHKAVLIMTALALVAILVITNWSKIKGCFNKVAKTISKATGISDKSIKKLLKGIMAGLPAALIIGKLFGGGLGSVFKLLGKIIGFTTKGMIKVLARFFTFMMANPLIAVITAIIGACILLYQAWKHNWGGIRDKTKAVIDFIKPKIESIKETFENVKEKCRHFKEKICEYWNNIKTFLSHPIKGTVSLIKHGNLSGVKGENALGTSYWEGGLSVVGEHGPEIVELPQGSRVHDNKDSKRMVGKGNGISITFGDVHVRKESDIDAIANAIVKKLQVQRLNMA